MKSMYGRCETVKPIHVLRATAVGEIVQRGDSSRLRPAAVKSSGSPKRLRSSSSPLSPFKIKHRCHLRIDICRLALDEDALALS